MDSEPPRSEAILLLSSIGSSHDPEAWSILQTFRDARDLGNITSMRVCVAGFKTLS